LIFRRLILLSDTPLKTDTEQLLRLYGEFHGQFAKYGFAEAVDYNAHRLFPGNAALLQLKNLVLADL
jgi:hypothetical protein